MYVHGLASGNNIKREDAIGGLVKLLSLEHLRAQRDKKDFDALNLLEAAKKYFMDFNDIDD